MTDYQIVALCCRHLVGEQFNVQRQLTTAIIAIAAIYYPHHEFVSNDASIRCGIQRIQRNAKAFDEDYAASVGYTLERTTEGKWVICCYPAHGDS